MVIFHSYVSLPEGNHDQQNTLPVGMVGPTGPSAKVSFLSLPAFGGGGDGFCHHGFSALLGRKGKSTGPPIVHGKHHGFPLRSSILLEASWSCLRP